MRKITYLLSLFLMMVGTAMAQTYATPGTEKVLTSENLRALATETPIILCPVQKDMYKQWYDGNSTTTYGTSGTLVTESNVFLWVPILSDGVATGTGYLKKRTAESDDVAYLQASNITTFGAQGTAQVFYPVTPVHGASGNSTAFDHSNIVSGYNEANLVRLVRGSSEGTTWFNFNGKQYNSGTGIWTAMEVRNAADMQTIIPPVTDLANLSNNKAYTLRTSRSDLVAKIGSSRIATTNDISGTFDENDSQYQFALLKNTSGSYYLYSISASKFVNKTGDLVNSPADPILFKDGNATGTFVIYFDASHYINIGGDNQLAINNWSTADGGNSYTITPVAEFSPSEELLNSINTVDVTVNFIVGEKTYSSANKRFTLNTAINAETFTTDLNGTYLTYASTNVETVTAETTTINVTCTAQPLPFIISENFENAKWYMVNMHSNEKNYMWTATNTNGTNPTLTVVDKGSVYKETTAPDDTRLWCFVGDVCGFKIYNKAVGSAYTMNKTSDGDNAVSWGEAGSGTLYHLQKTASNAITNGFCFLPIGHSYYLNHRVENIQGWTSRDEGSTCKIFTPDAFLLNYAADITAGPANSLGTAQYFNAEGKFENFNSAIAAANANHFDATATANLATILTDYASSDDNATTNAATITSGSYYRLMNCKYKNYMTSGLDGTTNTLWGGLSATDAPGTAGTIVKITADEDNYKMSAQGLEFGQITDYDARLNLTGGGLFTINNTGNKFTFMDVSTCDPAPSAPSYRAINQTSDNRILGWETSDDATKWYVIPATTLDLTLNTVEGKSYATTYLPFDVTLPDNVKAYIVTAAEDGKATVSEVTDIPANQGVVLVSETAAAKATLTLGTASANCTGNKLSGTNPRITISEKNDYYIFGKGKGDDGVGFYHPNSTTLKENRAYLPASAVTASGSVNGFKLDFGGVNTGIEAVIQADEANATYYDLSGRRVIRPAKGIYVKNGRKVYVK